jgi:site-specific recombinase XerD
MNLEEKKQLLDEAINQPNPNQSVGERALAMSKAKYLAAVDYDKLRSAIEMIPPKLNEYKACIATLYATGSRAAEILGSVRDDNVNLTVVPPITYDKVSLTHNNNRIDFAIFVAKKRGRSIFRHPVVRVDTEEWLFEILSEKFFKIDEQDNIVKTGEPKEICFKLTYSQLQYAYNKTINAELEIISSPHYLRHCRITHQMQHFGFNLQRIHQEYAWSNLSQALTYVHIEEDENKMSKFK